MSNTNQENNFTGYEVAVIGMAGRFPGASDIDQFWDNLKNGREGIRFFSEEELTESAAAPEQLGAPNFIKAKGTLDNVEYFDAAFFNYTLVEADVMDPQLRLLHQCAWHAVEDAAYDPESFAGSIGFYVGAGTPFSWLMRIMDRLQHSSTSESFSASAVLDGYSVSTQVAYRLNLKGPAMTIQTACSTSLVAIHTACQALLSGECHMALAGGVSVNFPLKDGYTYREGMINSSDGHTRSFDAKASGTLAGNGAGVVMLKPLENALEEHDHIYAIIKGTGMNNDGNRKIGYSAPSVKGQAEVIRLAQRAAEVEPESIGYVETHGSGTRIGDPVEIRALTRAFNSDNKQFCRIGSVKSNVGHLDAAAGVSGFIKTVLSLYHRQIPPSLHFENPNPEIDFNNTPFIVNTGLHQWQRTNGSPLRAGVSSFGIGGTNAHIVLEEAPQPMSPPASDESRKYHLLLISAKSEAALERNTANLAHYFKKHPDTSFPNAAYTLQKGRKAFEFRRSLICRSASQAIEILSPGSKGSDSLRPHTHRVVTQEKQPLIFMFSGLGSQYVNMGRDLYRDEPAFREEIDRCAAILKPITGHDIVDILYPEDVEAGTAQIHQPEIVQMVIFIFEYALAKLLISWGLTPDAMIGYSFGEYVAAALAHVFKLEDVLQLIVHRGNLIKRTPVGGMLSVPLPREEVEPLMPLSGKLSLAIDNGPSCIVAGPADDVTAFENRLKEQKCLSMRINTSSGIHSPLMNPILEEFEARVNTVSLNKPEIPYISNLTGRWISAEEATSPHNWAKHLTGTVRFSEGIRQLTKEPNAIFVEIGPGRDLSAMIQRALGENHRVVNLIRPRRKNVSDSAYLLDRVSMLWIYGKPVNWDRVFNRDNRDHNHYRIPLPAYSFDPQRFNLGGTVSIEATPQAHSAPETIPAATFKRAQLPDNYEAPRDGMEKKVAQSFQAVFGLEEIGIHDDFFELGGDSLKVISLVTKIHEQLDVDIPMEEVFTHSTVKDLANHIGQQAGQHIFASIPVAEEREYYPMTGPQKRVFIMEQIEEKSMAYTENPLLWMDGPLDLEKLEYVYREIVQRHESLRTGFFMNGDQPVQRIHPMDESRMTMEFIDLTRHSNGKPVSNDDIKAVVDDFLQPFDLASPPLWIMSVVKVSHERHLLMQMIHHIISDDISTGVMMIELSALYRGDRLEPRPIQYNDYVIWEAKAALTDDKLKNQEAYWTDRFTKAGNTETQGIPRLNMPFDFPRPELRSFEGTFEGCGFGAEGKNKLRELAKRNKTTLFTLTFTLYNILLYKYTGQQDIVVGIPITGRSHRDVQEMIGMFVNTLALRNFPNGEKTVQSFLEEVKATTLEAFSNQSYPFEDLVDNLSLPRDLGRNPLFDTMFVLHTVDIENINFTGIELTSHAVEHPACRFDMTFNVNEYGGGLNLGLEYCTALFKQETMRRFLDDFRTIVQTALENPDVKLDDIPSLEAERKEAEKQKILYRFNDTRADYKHDKTIKECIEDQVAKTPHAIALKGFKGPTAKLEEIAAAVGAGNPEEGKNNGSANQDELPTGGKSAHRYTLSYHQLNILSNRLAHRLRASGASADTIVALIADRNIEMIIGQIAVLKAGAAYLPIGPEYPEERVKYMVQHTRASIALGSDCRITFDPEVEIIDLTEAIEPAENRWESTDPSTVSSPRDLAYTIYTSGTTGIPKGVMIENRSVVNFIEGIIQVVPFTPKDTLLSLTTLAFDIFGLETLLPLARGSTVLIGSMEEQLDASEAAAVIDMQAVNILQVTPSRLKLFTTQTGASTCLNRLNYLLVGGEAFPPPLLDEVRALTSGRIINVYGPTETTIWSTLKDVTHSPLNIGTPMANQRVYILDGNDRLQPVGTPGELCISGHGVARGYFKDDELTAQKFIPNPFITEDDPDADGNRILYRTGDLARWLPDGEIECLGRVDHQVKIRGFRIEPGEIEHRLSNHESISEAVVLPKTEESGEIFLCAYIVPDKELEIPLLRAFLAGDLPDYMIPSHFVPLDKIPLNANGKIDRNALLNIKSTGLKSRAEYVAPKNEMEQLIADTWRDILKIEEIGTEDNFFDLGGTSLKIIAAIGKLKEALNRDIPVVTMFRYPTIVTMANFLSRQDAVPKRKDRTEIRKKGRERLGQKRRMRGSRRR